MAGLAHPVAAVKTIAFAAPQAAIVIKEVAHLLELAARQ